MAKEIINIRKAFICVRPSIFRHPGEHVTLQYIGNNPEWNLLQLAMDCWKEKILPHPRLVTVNGYANWISKDTYHSVALVSMLTDKDNYPKQNLHITLESSDKPIKPRQFDKYEEVFSYDYVNEVFLGYKDDKGAHLINVKSAHNLLRTHLMEETNG